MTLAISTTESEVLPGTALRRALRQPTLLLALVVPTFLLSLASTLPVLSALSTYAEYGDWTIRAAKGAWPAALVELASALLANNGPGDSGGTDFGRVAGGLQLGLMMGAIAVVLDSFAYTFLAGGILSRLDGTTIGFWAACRGWFWCQLRFGAAAIGVFVVLAAAGIGLLLLLPAPDPVSQSLLVVIVVLWLGWINGPLELARAQMVVGDSKSIRYGFQQVGRLGSPSRWKHLGRCATVWLVLAALNGALLGVSLPLVAAVPALATLLSFFLQQALLIAGAYLKLARLGAAVDLAQTTPLAAPKITVLTTSA